MQTNAFATNLEAPPPPQRVCAEMPCTSFTSVWKTESKGGYERVRQRLRQRAMTVTKLF